MFNKYEIRVIDSGSLAVSFNSIVYTNDLDNDGNSEQVYSYLIREKHAIQVYGHDGGMIDQWNPNGELAGFGKRLGFGDYDKDGFNEIYALYKRSDSVFIYCFEPLDTLNPIAFKDKLLCTLNNKYADPDPDFRNIKFYDLNGDSYGELVVIVKSGQAKFPRNLLAYDITNDSIIKSPDYGSIIENHWGFIDLENDGKAEIYGRVRASGNIQPDLGYEYNDYSAWVMVFNNDLQLKFKPIEFPGFTSQVEVYPVTIYDTSLLACYYTHIGALENFPKLFLVDAKGMIIKEHVFPKSKKNIRTLLVTKNEGNVHFNIIDSYGQIMVFNQDFKMIAEHDLNINIHPHPKLIDLDRNGTLEMVFSTKEKGIFITDQNFNNPVHFKYNFPLSIGFLSVILNGEDTPSLLFYNENKYITIKYDKNPLASLKYIIYLSIFLSIWLFIVAIQKLQLIQIRKKERIRNQIVNLQLKSFKNQMDPHFTFNVFNTMAYKIQKESPKSYEAFMEFSNLIRKILLSSDSITRSIEDELSQLKSYLELEKLRFPDKVFYKIEIEKEINQKMHIPKMILQTYVENAIKHGIRHKMDSGVISIIISKKNDALLFEITDDGIGRKKAKELATEGTGFGLKIMDNYFRLFNEYNVSKIKHEIIDLYDKDNKAAGTKVRILIPLNFSYKLKKHDKR